MSKIIQSATDFNNLLNNSKINAMQKFEETKTTTLDSLNKMHNKIFKSSQEVIFERSVLFAKILFIMILIILSYVNADVSYVKTYPKRFLNESIATGAMTIPPLIIMSMFRKNFDLQILINTAFLLFLIFFIFNVLKEFSGLNNHNYKGDSNDSAVKKVLNDSIMSDWFYSLSGISLFALILLSMQVRDFDIKKNGVKHFVEFLSFSVFNSIPILLINYNRNNLEIANSEFYKAFGIFGSLYIVLQGGGFFKNTIGEYE